MNESNGPGCSTNGLSSTGMRACWPRPTRDWTQWKPIRPWPAGASLAETYVGILFFVFVIAALAARLAPTRQESA
jgi:hypothetical protein